MTTMDKIKLGLAALEGHPCECEPEVNCAPCRYCAEEQGLKAAAAELEALKNENTNLREAVMAAADLFEGHSSKECDEQGCLPCLLNKALTKPTENEHDDD